MGRKKKECQDCPCEDLSYTNGDLFDEGAKPKKSKGKKKPVKKSKKPKKSQDFVNE